MNKGSGTATLTAPVSPLGLAAGQEVAPGVVFLADHLLVDEAVDGLVGDDGMSGFQFQATGHLLGRPAPLQAGIYDVAQVGVPLQPGPAPAAGPGQIISVNRLVATLSGTVAVQLPRDGRWRAIHLCRDLAH